MSLVCLPVFSQKTKKSGTGIEKALDDGMFRNSNSQLKIRVQPIINGYFNVNYEQKVGRRFGFEAGLGKQIFSSTFFETSRTAADFDHFDIKSTSGGFMGTATIKWYKSKYLNNNRYWGFKYTQLIYKTKLVPTGSYIGTLPNEQKVTTNSKLFYLTYGKNLMLVDNISIGFEASWGFASTKYKKIADIEDTVPPSNVTNDQRFFNVDLFTLDLFVGYLF